MPMFLPVFPSSFVLTTEDSQLDAVAMFRVVLEGADVLLAVGPLQKTLAVHQAMGEFASVVWSAVVPLFIAFAVWFADEEVAFLGGSIEVGCSTFSMHYIVFPVAAIMLRTVNLRVDLGKTHCTTKCGLWCTPFRHPEALSFPIDIVTSVS